MARGRSVARGWGSHAVSVAQHGTSAREAGWRRARRQAAGTHLAAHGEHRVDRLPQAELAPERSAVDRQRAAGRVVEPLDGSLARETVEREADRRVEIHHRHLDDHQVAGDGVAS